MHRPVSIIRFDQLFLTSLGLGLLNSVLSYRDSMQILNADPATAELGFGSGFIVSVLIFSLGISLLLWYLIAHRASNVAKWILVVLTAFGVLSMLPSLGVIFSTGLSGVLAAVITALQLAAIYFLFRLDAREWFNRRGRSGAADANVFD